MVVRGEWGENDTNINKCHVGVKYLWRLQINDKAPLVFNGSVTLLVKPWPNHKPALTSLETLWFWMCKLLPFPQCSTVPDIIPRGSHGILDSQISCPQLSQPIMWPAPARTVGAPALSLSRSCQSLTECRSADGALGWGEGALEKQPSIQPSQETRSNEFAETRIKHT